MSSLPCMPMAEQFVHLCWAFILHLCFQFAAVGLNVLLSQASSPLTITLQTDYRELSATTGQFFILSMERIPLTFNFRK